MQIKKFNDKMGYFIFFMKAALPKKFEQTAPFF